VPAQDNSVYVLLSKVSACYVIIPILIGSIRFRYLSSAAKSVFALMIVAMIIDNISYIFRNQHFNTAYFLRVYTILEFILLSLFFIYIANRNSLKIVMKVMIVLFSAVAVFDALFQGIMSMDSISIAVESIVFILYSIASFLLLMKDASYLNILSASRFWMITAILLYFSGNLFLFVFSNHLLLHTPDSFNKLWAINSVLSILFYSLIAIGFWKVKTQSQ
jgi:hypothetical protein